MKLLFPALFLLLSGCATLKNGTTQQILVTSTPPGAVVVVDGDEQGQTPLMAEFSRKKAHVLTVELEGFDAQSREISPQSQRGALFRNLIWVFFLPALPVGFGVDLFNGAHRHFPYNQFSFQLESRSAVSSERSDSAAPDLAMVTIGKRVRVAHWDGLTSKTATTIGTLRAFAADTFVVEASGSSVLYRIPRASIASLDMSLGGTQRAVSGGRVATGALFGLAGGLALGLFGAMWGGDPAAVFAPVAVGTVIGAAAGAIIGPSESDTEKWVNVCCGSAR